MKLNVDCALSAESGLQDAMQLGNLAYLLAKAKVTPVAMPLEALTCEQYGLRATPDYPIAAIAAAADGLKASDGYWLRADPVNLVLQRDCFSLGEPIPLQLEQEHAARLVASLNEHFSQDGLTFLIGKSGAWYLQAHTDTQITTTLPSVAASKNVHQFMPQGEQAAKWLAVLNETQMLLHEHAVNVAREASRELAVNSIWLSGSGAIPEPATIETDADLIMANDVLYQGLAIFTHTPCLALPVNLDDILQHSVRHVRLHLPQISNLQVSNLDDLWFKPLLNALKNKKIKQLVLNLGFYEKSLSAEITPVDLYKFWRSTKPVTHYLS